MKFLQRTLIDKLASRERNDNDSKTVEKKMVVVPHMNKLYK